jgi:unspecific monooxygenase
MKTIAQSPTQDDFVQNPYPFYHACRAQGPVVFWQDYGMPAVVSHTLVQICLKDRRLGREIPADKAQPVPPHVQPFYDIEAHSMLELEPPRQTRLRRLVLQAFTSRRIAAMEPKIAALCHHLLDNIPDGPFDLLEHLAKPLPVTVICRLLGVPEEMGPQLLDWSNAMVAMYQARRTRAIEDAAAKASTEFVAFLRGYIETRRRKPADDLITELIRAEEDGDRLSMDEMISTCILLLNAGHEATVHTLGNGVKALLEAGLRPEWLSPEGIAGTVEEILRYDPPLHMFTRWVYEPVDLAGHSLHPGDQVALLLGAAGRDPQMWEDPDEFDPTRPAKTHSSFGGGLHFCVGAPLARLELQVALPILFQRLPNLKLAETPRYADVYHFHGLERLLVTA